MTATYLPDKNIVETLAGEYSKMKLDSEDILLAEEFKNKANIYFKSEDYKNAVQLYDKAIEKNPNSSVLFANRSFAHLKMESYGYALNDASKAIELDRNYVKGYYRRAAAYMALGKFKNALKDYETVTKVYPHDKDAKLKYNECNKIVKAQAFEKAIAIDKIKKSVAESIVLDTIAIEAEYEGPQIKDNKINLEFAKELKKFYTQQKKLHKKWAFKILLDVRDILLQEPPLVDIHIKKDQKLTVCGDVHGQYYDLLHIFELNGFPSQSNLYLFNGDFVDRGSFSVEVMLTLFTYKILYPQSFFLSRGNHETWTMNQAYGFEGEVKSKYSQLMFNLFREIFCQLPLAYLVQDKILGSCANCSGQTRNPKTAGPPSKRGIGISFGPDVTKRFLEKNGLDYIVRSHEVKDNGYEVAHDGGCITVFSAPNYCDTTGNKGAFITLTADNLKPTFTTFEAVPHPNVKPMAYANSLMGFL